MEPRQPFSETLASLLPSGMELTECANGSITASGSIRRFGSLKDMLKTRHQLETALRFTEGQTTSETEAAAIRSGRALATALGEEIARIKSQNTFPGQFSGEAYERATTPNITPENDKRFAFSSVAIFLQNPEEHGIRAALSEGGDLQNVVPSYEVAAFRAAYAQIDPFSTAGASITTLEGPWSDAKVPFVLPGVEPSTYAETAGPTNDESASVVVVSLDTPEKRAFLSKPTEEAWEDIPTLAGALTREGIRRIFDRDTKAITAALVTSLGSANATVLKGSSDNYADLLNMISAVPTHFAAPDNVWMGSRTTRTLIANTRVGADNLPVFSPDLSTCLSYRFVLNDHVQDGDLLFGNFQEAVHIRRSAMHLQLINEAYREAGKIGLRFYIRAARAFFSDVANQATAEQPVYLLASDFGS